jgi:hypothetical protein
MDFKTSINGLWVSLSGLGFQDLESSPSYGRLIFFPSLFSASIVTFPGVHHHFSLCPVVIDGQTHARTQQVTLYVRVGARDDRTQSARACLFFFLHSKPIPQKLKNLKPNTVPSSSFFQQILDILIPTQKT